MIEGHVHCGVLRENRRWHNRRRWGDDESTTSNVKNDWLGLALVEQHLRKARLASPHK